MTRDGPAGVSRQILPSPEQHVALHELMIEGVLQLGNANTPPKTMILEHGPALFDDTFLFLPVKLEIATEAGGRRLKARQAARRRRRLQEAGEGEGEGDEEEEDVWSEPLPPPRGWIIDLQEELWGREEEACDRLAEQLDANVTFVFNVTMHGCGLATNRTFLFENGTAVEAENYDAQISDEAGILQFDPSVVRMEMDDSVKSTTDPEGFDVDQSWGDADERAGDDGVQDDAQIPAATHVGRRAQYWEDSKTCAGPDGVRYQVSASYNCPWGHRIKQELAEAFDPTIDYNRGADQPCCGEDIGWHLDRLDQDANCDGHYTKVNARGTRVFVLDTGIQADHKVCIHPDFSVLTSSVQL